LSGMARSISVSSFIGGLVVFSVFVAACVGTAAWLYNRFTNRLRYQTI
jgi:small-conductance mechanosensitive channel